MNEDKGNVEKQNTTVIENFLKYFFLRSKEERLDTPSKFIHAVLKHINDVIIEDAQLQK